MTPKWTEMLTTSLNNMGLSVTDYNSSMGGQVSQWAATNAQAKIVRYSPDLVVLGWGMNDGSLWNNVSPATYKTNIKLTINKIRASLPDCEFILIGTMLPNPEAVEFVGPHEEYTAKLYEIQKEYSGIAVANMTQIHKYILTRKNYRDISGNNVNHPNDFISRMYLQVLLETISK
jgi:lysophospholipase L1-like esterase